jgi:3-oxoacyl-[acyl-carrier-protein] synthase-3
VTQTPYTLIGLDEPVPATADASGLDRPVGLLGTGLYLPRTVITNEEISRGLDTSDEWIRERIGIRERRFAEPTESTSDMCLDAARTALAHSGTEPAELDAIVLATVTADQPLPSTALMVKEALGADRAIPVDLTQMACAGGVYGMLLGMHLLQNREMHRVLVVGAESLSRLTDPTDRTTRIFFGDGAGAVVLGPVAPGYGLLSWDFGSRLSYGVQVAAGGSRRPTTHETVVAGDHFLRMDGRVVWDTATASLPGSVRRALARAGIGLEEVQHYFFHQANRNLLQAVLQSLGIPPERAPITVDVLGNTGGASVFTVLHPAMSERRVRRGDLVVISAIGAGFVWGTLCLRHY